MVSSKNEAAIIRIFVGSSTAKAWFAGPGGT